jgi:hypothetical protein
LAPPETLASPREAQAGRLEQEGAWAEGARAIFDAWGDFRVEAEEFRELDGERVLVLYHLSGRGKTSGLDLGQVRAKGADLLHVRDGKVTKYVIHFDRERAFADLGLDPEGG